MTDSPSGIGPKESDLTGRQFGDYRLLRRLGRGAMAEVYLAEQKSLRRNVAFKVLKTELATDEKYIQRFHMEARAAAVISKLTGARSSKYTFNCRSASTSPGFRTTRCPMIASPVLVSTRYS